MRYSTLLLTSSLALHGSDNRVGEAMAAATIGVNEPNQDHTSLEINHDIRSQRFLRSNDTTEDEERMIDRIRALMSRKTPEQIFEKISAGRREASLSSNINHVLNTMNHDEIWFAREIYKKDDRVLADEFVSKWGGDAVATALLFEAKNRLDPKIEKKANKLFKDLMKSWSKQAGDDYGKVFNLLGLESYSNAAHSFDWRLALLDEYIKYRSRGQPNDELLFETLLAGFGGAQNLAPFIANAKTDRRTKETAKAFETRFIQYFVSSGATAESFFRRLDLSRHGYEIFQQPEFKMIKQFLVLKEERHTPQDILEVLIKGFNGERNLAIELSKGLAADPGHQVKLERYEKLLFQHLKNEGYVPSNIDRLFKTKEITSTPVRTFKERYREWYRQKPSGESSSV